MVPTHEQQLAIDSILSWCVGAGTQFVLKGAAGTGKSTVMKFIVEQHPNAILLAPTGKAAVRLTETTGKPAKTIHSVCYRPHQHEDGGVSFSSKDKWNARLAIVDEASMVTSAMAADLSFAFTKVLYVGDPFQLPPVKALDWFGSVKADATLDTVHRQALDSPILRIATRIRRGEVVGPKDAVRGVLDIVPQKSIDWKGLAVDQIICGTNKSRSLIIKARRTRNSPVPASGEPVINLSNTEIDGAYIANGSIMRVEAITPKEITVEVDGVNLVTAPYFPHHFAKHYNPNAPDPPAWHKDNKDFLRLDFAHAITIHKSQGSGWPSVLFYDDLGYIRDPLEKRRAIYTAVTRSAQRLIWAI